MKLGNNDISSVKIGSTDVNKIYIGSTEVWSSFTGLLDTYTGAAAAYSLRQLKSGVTNAIRVRRASDNAESDIGFVSGQLDTSTLETFCSGTDGFVTTWYDQSGNGNDASQSTSANQPQIVSSGSTITENSKPSVQFDGTDDYLIISNASTITQPFTFFNVITKTGDAFNRDVILGWSTFSFIGRYNGNDMGIYAGSYLVDSKYNVTSQISQYALFDGSNSSYSQNSDTITGNAGTRDITGDIYIGVDSNTGNDLNGTIQEIIFYPSDQSSNRTNIETNINNFYNIY